MKTRIEYRTLNENSEPIVIENLKVFKNKVGQWIITFNSKNHKYLEERGSVSQSYWADGKIQTEQGLEFSTYETFFDADDYSWHSQDSFMSFGPNSGHFGSFHWTNGNLKHDWFGRMGFGREKFELPNRIVEIYLIPETEEEEKEINGTFCCIPLKWQYGIVVIPYDHFQNPKYLRNSEEFEVVN